jgi:putative SOS response-associated peptidase YedK
MCGRYSLSSPAQLVQEVFDAELDATVEAAASAGMAPRPARASLVPRWNIAPTQEAPVVRRRDDGGGRRLDLLRWGLAASREERGSGHINARGETAATLAAFRDGFRARRCLVPADGFYEWRRAGRERQPFHIRFADRRLFAMAGLWSPWAGTVARHPPGVDAWDAAENESAIPGSFTIVTCPPSGLIAPLHDRMPVILPPAAWEAWLRPAATAAELAALFVPWADGGMEMIAVDPWVNHADHEGERCVRELSAADAAPRQLGLF